jgi:hypothetical protein
MLGRGAERVVRPLREAQLEPCCHFCTPFLCSPWPRLYRTPLVFVERPM